MTGVIASDRVIARAFGAAVITSQGTVIKQPDFGFLSQQLPGAPDRDRGVDFSRNDVLLADVFQQTTFAQNAGDIGVGRAGAGKIAWLYSRRGRVETGFPAHWHTKFVPS